MESTAVPQSALDTPEFLSGGGELGQRIREYDWTATPLGPVHTWPQSLRTCIRIMLTSRQPIWIGWGKDLIKFYNDPYKAIVGGKHPWALGAPASVVWKDIWHDISPLLKQVMEKDEGTYAESQLLIMERNGYPEETYYTFSYTPIPGDDGTTAGMICANSDDTDRIISERQLKTLTQLDKGLTGALTDEAVIAKAMLNLKENPYDFTFALYYAFQNNKAILSGATLPVENFPAEIDLNEETELGGLLQEALRTRQLQIIEGIKNKFGDLPSGAWETGPEKVMIMPIMQTTSSEPYGFLITGLNPFRLADEKYTGFLSLIADQLTSSFANVHMLEEERKRAAALAEIDRAKTTFFSNISHEFRTPLTLLLGPIEEMLNDPDTLPANRSRVEMAHRNALRMQKLVNTLLDFSRIEAGRMDGSFSKTDIARFTGDLVSNFRSAVEKAGMKLEIVQEQISGDVYVDMDMWEKIILNLVSNAFKYSNTGTICVTTKQEQDNILTIVSDTGIGIPADQLEKIFSRFHRVENTDGRSQEGTGIGLAMVRELVKLHNGTISVTSTPGKGSTFTVSIPAGKAHLPADKITEEPVVQLLPYNGRAFVEEAGKWLPDDKTVLQEREASAIPAATDIKYTVLLADDNADMREYVQRLLSDQFTVVVAVNGEDAFHKMLEYRPDLLLSDIMMPKMSGFELLEKVRAHPDLKNTPVIFLSARAGEEAKVEGLDAGADDYIVKPFSAKELLVRVGNHIRINQVRRETELQFYQLFLQAPALINVFKGPEHRYEFFHPGNKALFGNKDFTGMAIREAIPEIEGQGIVELLDEVYQQGRTIVQNERYVTFKDENGQLSGHYINFIYQPLYDIRKKIQGVLNFAIDVTDGVKSRMHVEESEKRFRNLVMQAPVSIMVLTGRDLLIDVVNDSFLEMIDRQRDDFTGKPLWEMIPEARDQGFHELLLGVLDSGQPFTGFEQEVIINRHGIADMFYVNFIYSPLKDMNDQPIGIMVVATEVTAQVIARKKIEESELALNELANAMPQLVWVSNTDGEVLYYNDRIEEFTPVTRLDNGHWTWQELIHPDELEETGRKWQEAVAAGDVFQMEHRICMKDGSYRWHLSRGVPQRDPEGQAVKWFGTATDMHMAKEQATILEQEVKHRTHELRALNISLRQSNEDLQQFAHVASHDLKEPVRKIKTFSSRLQDKYGLLLPDEGQGFLDKVHHAADRMFSMIDGVLTYSTLNASEKTIETIDLNETFISIQADLEVAIQQKKAQINKAKLPVIEGASVLIYQLFYNLVNNSLKFAKQEEAPVIIINSRLVLQDDVTYAVISLEDNGIGFDQEYATRIFDTFARLNSKDKYEGTGLGLSLCRKIAERHKGSISAESTEGKGAVFSVMLPLKQTQKSI